MPLPKGGGKAAVGRDIKEFKTGKTYARTKAKFGKERADKQAIAVGMNAAGVGRKKKRGKK